MAKKTVALFLNHRYRAKDNSFYMKIYRAADFTIAVDGGIRFFTKNKIRPDLLIGDFDSTPRLSKKYLAALNIEKYPAKKDKTDSQLAVDAALRCGAKAIEICGAISRSEIDHFLGNIFLLEIINRYNLKNKNTIMARLVSPKGSLYLLHNSSAHLVGDKGDFISIIPLSNNLRLDFTGLEYSPPTRRVNIGESLTLRNRLRLKSSHVSVENGRAIVVLSAWRK